MNTDQDLDQRILKLRQGFSTENPVALANLLEKQGRNRDALELLHRFPSTDPKSELLEAKAYLGLGETVAAQAVLLRSLHRTPDHTEARLLLVEVLEKRNEVDRAYDVLKRIVEREEQYAEVLEAFCERNTRYQMRPRVETTPATEVSVLPSVVPTSVDWGGFVSEGPRTVTKNFEAITVQAQENQTVHIELQTQDDLKSTPETQTTVESQATVQTQTNTESVASVELPVEYLETEIQLSDTETTGHSVVDEAVMDDVVTSDVDHFRTEAIEEREEPKEKSDQSLLFQVESMEQEDERVEQADERKEEAEYNAYRQLETTVSFKSPLPSYRPQKNHTTSIYAVAMAVLGMVGAVAAFQLIQQSHMSKEKIAGMLWPKSPPNVAATPTPTLRKVEAVEVVAPQQGSNVVFPEANQTEVPVLPEATSEGDLTREALVRWMLEEKENEVIEHLEAAGTVQTDPALVDVKVESLLRLGRLSEAKETLSTSTELFPITRARVLLAEGKGRDVRDMLVKEFQFRLHTTLGPIERESRDYLLLGQAALIAGDVETAYEALEDAEKMDPHSPEAALFRSELAVRGGAPKEAGFHLKHLQGLLSDHPRGPRFIQQRDILLARTLMLLGQKREAIETLEASIEGRSTETADQNVCEAYFYLGENQYGVERQASRGSYQSYISCLKTNVQTPTRLQQALLARAKLALE